MSEVKAQWSSNFGFIMAMIASAVGLGSIWRFPYLVGSNGGSTFIIIYMVMLLVIGILSMAVEVALGRNSGKDAVDAYTQIAPRTKLLGYSATLTGFLLMSIYSVLGGWTLHYFIQALSFKLTKLPSNNFEIFTSTLSPLFWQVIFTALTMFILKLGVSKGIEKYSTIMNFLLFTMILIVAIRSITLPGAFAGIQYLFQPDLAKFSDPSVWLMATGQVFFSLSLGSGGVIIYGCYVHKKSNILQSGIITSFTTIGIALLMGLAIFPAVFAMGQNPDSGPGLLFNVLPGVFAQIPGGDVFAILFFGATFFAALTSAIAMVEPTLTRLTNTFTHDRKKSALILFLVLIVIGTPMALSGSLLKNFLIFGETLFDNINFLIDKFLMPINSLIALFLAGWLWKDRGIIKELSNQGTLKIPASNFILWMIRVIIPIIIIIIMIQLWIN